jgi:hypothetical protein
VAHISTYAKLNLTLAPSATANIDVRMDDVNPDAHFDVQQTWARTGSPSGIAMNLYPGYGGKDPAESLQDPIPQVTSILPAVNTTIPVFANNFLSVTTVNGFPAIVNPIVSTNTTQTTNTGFYLNGVLNAWPRWVRFQVINQDASNSVLINLFADI